MKIRPHPTGGEREVLKCNGVPWLSSVAFDGSWRAACGAWIRTQFYQVAFAKDHKSLAALSKKKGKSEDPRTIKDKVGRSNANAVGRPLLTVEVAWSHRL